MGSGTGGEGHPGRRHQVGDSSLPAALALGHTATGARSTRGGRVRAVWQGSWEGLPAGYLPTGDRLRFAAGKLVVSHGLGVIKGIVGVSLNSP